MAFLEETGQALIDPLVSLWNAFVGIMPGLIGALVVLIIGYLIGTVFGFVTKKVMQKAKVDKLVLEKTTLNKLAGEFKLSTLLAIIVKWYIFVLFLSPAATLINLTALSDFLSKAALWIPNLIAAVILALVGLIAADYVFEKVHDLKAKSSRVIAHTAKIVIIIFTVMISLKQIGIDISVAENTFLIVLAGIVFAVALGFGLAMKDELKPTVKNILRKL